MHPGADDEVRPPGNLREQTLGLRGHEGPVPIGEQHHVHGRERGQGGQAGDSVTGPILMHDPRPRLPAPGGAVASSEPLSQTTKLSITRPPAASRSASRSRDYGPDVPLLVARGDDGADSSARGTRRPLPWVRPPATDDAAHQRQRDHPVFEHRHPRWVPEGMEVHVLQVQSGGVGKENSHRSRPRPRGSDGSPQRATPTGGTRDSPPAPGRVAGRRAGRRGGTLRPELRLRGSRAPPQPRETEPHRPPGRPHWAAAGVHEREDRGIELPFAREHEERREVAAPLPGEGQVEEREHPGEGRPLNPADRTQDERGRATSASTFAAAPKARSAAAV